MVQSLLPVIYIYTCSIEEILFNFLQNFWNLYITVSRKYWRHFSLSMVIVSGSQTNNYKGILLFYNYSIQLFVCKGLIVTWSATMQQYFIPSFDELASVHYVDWQHALTQWALWAREGSYLWIMIFFWPFHSIDCFF